MDEETSGRPARQVALPLERRHLLGWGEGQHGMEYIVGDGAVMWKTRDSQEED